MLLWKVKIGLWISSALLFFVPIIHWSLTKNTLLMDNFSYFYPLASGLLACQVGLSIGFFYHHRLAQQSNIKVVEKN